jgi:RNA polymerase sigma-70 factor (ECF subfamily)
MDVKDPRMDEKVSGEDRDGLIEALAALTDDLLAFLRHHTGDPDVGSDLTQEALCRALTGLDRLRTADALHGWLFRIGINVFNDWLRRGGRARQELGEGERADPRQQRPEREVLARELDDVLRAEMCALPERQRSVLLLHGVRGLDQPAIAALLGIRTGAVKTALFHARERMRRRLDRYLGREPL